MSTVLDEVMRHVARAMNAVRAPFRVNLNGRLNLASRTQLADIAGLATEQPNGVELMQHYGFTSSPPASSDGIAVPLGGRTSQAVVVATDGPGRYVLEARGESALYCIAGTFVHLRADGTLLINAPGTVTIQAPTVRLEAAEVVIDAPIVRVTGDLQVAGDITDRTGSTGGSSMQSMRAVYNSHTHPEHDSGGPTDPPLQEM